jgi:hypothetical protein
MKCSCLIFSGLGSPSLTCIQSQLAQRESDNLALPVSDEERSRDQKQSHWSRSWRSRPKRLWRWDKSASNAEIDSIWLQLLYPKSDNEMKELLFLGAANGYPWRRQWK